MHIEHGRFLMIPHAYGRDRAIALPQCRALGGIVAVTCWERDGRRRGRAILFDTRMPCSVDAARRVPLAAVAASRSERGDALARLRSEMLRNGFQVVREAALIGQQRMAENLLPG